MSFSPLKNGLLPFLALSISTTVIGQAFDGFTLYNRMNQGTAYLIDADEQIAHTWNCPTNANYSMALKPNGNLVRGAVYSGNVINTAAVGGMVQELDPDGDVVWSFTYSTANYVTHHDMCLMPNGNVLLLAYVKHTLAELQAMGYTGTTAKYPGRIIEIQPSGSTASIVWEWNLKDHFCQHADATKPNYMVIAEHPERLNINVTVSGGGGPGGGIDWFHENGLDYNAELDQIVLSSRYLSEFFIIDHSTTTAEAAGSTGGNGGRGGDFLFRWGKSANYGIAGLAAIPAATHDAHWIPAGRPNAGWIQFVNNSGSGGNTTVDAINPAPVGYNYPWTPGTVWGPSTYGWRHVALANASGQSTAERMPNGNIFCAISGQYMYEATEAGDVVWQYSEGPPTAFRYLCDDPGILALLGDPCGLNTDVVSATAQESIGVFPNPGNGLFTLKGVDTSKLTGMVVVDATGREVLRIGAGPSIDLGGHPDGIYQVILVYRTGERAYHKVVVQR